MDFPTQIPSPTLGNGNTNGMKKVVCPITTGKGKTYWLRVGSAFPNRDGSTNIYLDAYPSNGKLQIRDFDERDQQPPRFGAGPGHDRPAVGGDELPF